MRIDSPLVAPTAYDEEGLGYKSTARTNDLSKSCVLKNQLLQENAIINYDKSILYHIISTAGSY